MPDALRLTQAQQALVQDGCGEGGGAAGTRGVNLGNIAAEAVCPAQCSSHKNSKHWDKVWGC
jgi:hypothetical protein